MQGDIVISSFDLLMQNKDMLPVITIYCKPTDYPDNYVARLWFVEAGNQYRSVYVVIAENIDQIRALIPYTMHRFDSNLEDDPVIVETWI